jgi:hypothetical protein
MSGQRRTPLRAKETAAAKQRFIDALASSGVVLAAVRAAGVARSVVYEWRAADEAFRSAWLEALDDSSDLLEAEAVRRAARGTPRPVFYRGEQVGSITEYSDALLMFLLKARRPETYREQATVRHEGRVSAVVSETSGVPVERTPDELAAIVAALEDAGVLLTNDDEREDGDEG